MGLYDCVDGKMMTDILIFMAAGLAAGGASLPLFRIARQTIHQAQAEESLSEETVPEPVVPRWFLGLMFPVNIALALFMGLYYRDGFLNILNTLCLCAVLWPCAWCDAKVFLIPNRILLVGTLAKCGLLAVEALSNIAMLPAVVLGSVVSAGILLVVCLLCRLLSPNSIGFGDVKLLMLMGFFLGTDRIWGAMILSMAVTFVYALGLLLFGKATGKTEMPFAPLLLAGTVLAGFLTSV